MIWFLIAAGMFLWAAGLVVGIRWKRDRHPLAPAPQDQLIKTIEGMTLSGPNLTWLATSPATYGCERCGEFQATKLKQYLYGDNIVVGLMTHVCSGEKHTDVEVQVAGGAAAGGAA